MWTVYIVHCQDGTYYTGITNDVDKRIATHNIGKGAKYTMARRPVRLVYTEAAQNRSEATKRERCIKRLNRTQKERLIHT
ncbi:MAG: GIY-YIG nuclease family protein [Robiginitomaculum sp.]